MKPDILRKLQNTVVLKPVESYVKTVRVQLLQSKERRSSLGTFEVAHDFWVAEITDDCILGLDFLIKHDCQVNIKDSVLQLQGEEIPLQKPYEVWPPTYYRVVSRQCPPTQSS